MGMGGGGGKEPRSSKELRRRQLSDLADLDEKENRRIKALLRARQGGRAFRAPSATRTSGASASPGSGTASGAAPASLIPASGFGGRRSTR